MSVKVQHTLKESWSGLTEHCVSWTRLGESVHPDSTLQILFMFRFEVKIFGRPSPDGLTPGRLIFQQRFPWSQNRFRSVSRMSSTDHWNVVFGVASCSWWILQTGWSFGSWVGRILDSWLAQWRRCWRMVASMLQRVIRQSTSLLVMRSYQLMGIIISGDSFSGTALVVSRLDSTKSISCKHAEGWRGPWNETILAVYNRNIRQLFSSRTFDKHVKGNRLTVWVLTSALAVEEKMI